MPPNNQLSLPVDPSHLPSHPVGPLQVLDWESQFEFDRGPTCRTKGRRAWRKFVDIKGLQLQQRGQLGLASAVSQLGQLGPRTPPNRNSPRHLKTIKV